MSSPSRKRERARAWMHAERAKRDELEARLRKEKEQAIKEARADERERQTFMLAPDDDMTITPLGKPEQVNLVVASTREDPLNVDRIFNRRDLRYYPMPKRFHLRATQHALVLPDGVKVVWYGWEYRG